MNEAFRAAGGPGGPGGFGGPGGRGLRGAEQGPPPTAAPGGDGVKLDPLVGLDDAKKPLRSKLLAVPALRTRYLEMIRTLADKHLDWKNLGPVVASYRDLAAKDIVLDTRKTSTTAQFENLTSDQPGPTEAPRGFGHGSMALRTFADQRREFLLSLPAVSGGN